VVQTFAMSKTLFQRIIAREIPARIEHEDELCIVIHDIEPQSPVHLLIIPKEVIARVGDAVVRDEAILGHLLVTAGVVAKKLQLERGFRLVINHGPDACESVPHLHVHLLAKRQLSWPPG
jgi:histidine triad (HIT) family protein